MKITIMGAGSWGTTLAHILAQRGHTISLWAREQKTADEINNHHTNNTYLKKVKLESKIMATHQLADALKAAELAIIVIPSPYVRDITQKMSKHIPNTLKFIISASKGLEPSTGKRMSEVIEEEIKNVPVAVLTGPNHAEEVINNIPTATVLASENKAVRETLQKELSTPHFKVYPIEDIIGAEYCGALKNVCAIAVGVSKGLHLGDNATGSIITLGLAEMARVGAAFGAKRETYYGLAGVGDLVATCTSSHSRNLYLGEQLAKKKTFEEITKEMKGMVAEGANTARVLNNLAKKQNINLPLTKQVYEVIYKEKEVEKAVKDLLTVL
jgi:glycerol-3-phosphate dehydrogenase (NAD(P)+)